jgi:hypothetical protein
VFPLVLVWGILLAPFAVALGIAVWGGASLLVDVWHCRHPRAETRERFRDFCSPSTLADEAQRWLRNY